MPKKKLTTTSAGEKWIINVESFERLSKVDYLWTPVFVQSDVAVADFVFGKEGRDNSSIT